MDSNTIHNEIRDLLDRFYAGETTRGEETRLARLLRSSENLPEDLEAERQLFMAMAEPEEGEAEIPAALQARIDTAISMEFSKARRGRTRRLAILAGASAAACALVIWTLAVMLSGNGTKGSEELAVVKRPTVEKAEAKDVDEAAAKTKEIKTSTSKGLAKAETAVTVSKPRRCGATAKSASMVDQIGSVISKGVERSMSIDPPKDMRADAGEPRKVSANTRIVTDEREARRMVEEANARYESSVRMVNCRIQEMNSQYEAVRTRVNTTKTGSVTTHPL